MIRQYAVRAVLLLFVLNGAPLAAQQFGVTAGITRSDVLTTYGDGRQRM